MKDNTKLKQTALAHGYITIDSGGDIIERIMRAIESASEQTAVQLLQTRILIPELPGQLTEIDAAEHRIPRG